MLTGYATLLPEGRTPWVHSIIPYGDGTEQLKYHISERDIDLELDPHLKINLYYKFKIPP